MSRIKFLREGFKDMKTTGAVTRSSKALCQGMIKPVDFSKARLIIELGAGDGVITKHILKSMHEDCKLISFEINPIFCEKLRQINDSRLIIAADSAENIGQYIESIGEKEVDYVISAIPFVTLPNELGYDIVGKCRQYLKKDGLFVQLHYSFLVKKIYMDIFNNLKIKFVPWNIPPAFVFICKKE